MKFITLFSSLLIGFSILVSGQLKPGDPAIDFDLISVKGERVGLDNYHDKKGLILLFTSNVCPFALAYEDRIIAMHNNFGDYGYPVVAINPNDEKISPDDTMERMIEHASEKNFPFEYLKDNGKVYKTYGATRTPEVFLLKNDGLGNYIVTYRGTIDSNAMDEKSASEKYLFQAIAAIENNISPSPAETQAIGCTIKQK